MNNSNKVNRLNKMIIAGVLAVLFVIILVSFIFFGVFIPEYKVVVQQETAIHLKEIVAALSPLIGNRTDSDWLLAQSYAVGLADASQQELAQQARKLKDKCGLMQVRVYTDAQSFDQDGNIIPQQEVDALLTLLGSNTNVLHRNGDFYEYIYSVSDVTVTQGGVEANVKAVSLIRDMRKLLAENELQPFGGKALVYLTDGNGNSVNLTESAPHFEGDLLDNVAHGDNVYFDDFKSLDELLATEKTIAFLHSDDTGEYYCVISPLANEQGDERVIYFVASTSVNQVMSKYYNAVVWLCIGIIILVSVLSVSVFLALYRIYSRKMSAELTSRDHLFSTLVSQTENVFALLRRNQSGYAYLSPNAERLFGAHTPLLSLTDEGLRIDDSDTDVDYSSVKASLEAWDGVSNYTSDYVTYTVEGKVRSVVLMLYANKLDPDEYIAVARDVTEERRREQLLAEALTAAETANKAKTVFLANVSHDIRTPMNAIINVMRFARENANDPVKIVEYMDIVERSSNHLLQLINDLLDMSRIESNKLIINSQETDVCEVVREVNDIIQPLCAAKRQKFTVSTDADSVKVMGDRTKLVQILTNLLNNAVKFTPKNGSISLNVTHHATMNDRIAVHFTVSDNGIGIAEENIDKVFQPFMRVADKRIDAEGTGLGLPIVKSFVEAMGGTITVNSKLGAGTTFSVAISFAAVDREALRLAAEKTEEVDFSGINALVAEDNVLNRRIISMVLTKLGVKVTMANDGKELVELFVSSPVNTYQCILTDIYMPVMDGYEATRQIRSLHRADATLPIIAVSANVFVEDMDKGAECGLDDYIGKPIDITAIKTVLKKYLRRE